MKIESIAKKKNENLKVVITVFISIWESDLEYVRLNIFNL